MATASTSSETLAVATWGDAGPEASKSDRYLARRLAAAGSDYKSVVALTFVLAASVGGMLWLLLGIVLEHWVVPGGLPGWFRWAWLAAAAVALAAAIVRWIVPLLRYRVNLVYAARAIEADHPELHNDLVNAVLVKAHPDAAAHSVVRTLERRAAKRLSTVPAEGVVDRGLAMRLALALAGLVAAACIYELAAPKSLLVSAARLLAPWASVAPPARVRIEPPRLAWRHPGAAAEGGGQLHPLDVGSGTVTVVRGRQLVVSSRIRGLDRDERAELVVSRVRDNGKVDAGVAPWRAAMTPDAEGRQVATLPDAARGLEHGIEFTIVAGDASGDRVRVAVVDTPALLVREVRYEYPAYTRRPPETAAWQGDLRGVEGTKVTIVAEGNRPLDAAWIDLGCDGKKDVPLRVGQHDLSRATGSFALRLNADRTGPAANSYRLGFQPQSGGGTGREDAVLEKLEHRIEVSADLAPEVAIEEPRQKALKVPPGAPVAVRVRAVDPDFGIARVTLETRLKGGEIQPEIEIFRGDKTGVVMIDGAIMPERQGAGPGSVLEYRAVATDNRTDPPNVARTEWRSLEIDPSAPPPPAPPRREDQPPQKEQPGQQKGQPEKEKGRPGQQGQEDGKQQGQQPGGQQGQQSGGQQGGQQAGQEGGQQGQKQGGQEDKPQGGAQGQREGGQQGAGEQQGQQQGQQQKKGPAGGKDLQQPGEQQGAKDGGGRPENGQPKGDGEKEKAEGRPQPGAGQRRENGTVAHDGTNDGEAMERLLEHRKQEQGKGKSGESGQQPQQAEPARQEGKPQDGRASEQNKENASDHEHAECRDANGKPCGKKSCPSCKGGSAAGGGAAGGQAQGDQTGQGEQPGGQQGQREGQGEGEGGQQGQGKAGDQQRGESGDSNGGQQGDGRGESQGTGQGKDGEGKDGAGKDAGQKPGSAAAGKQGEGKPGQSQGDGQPQGAANQSQAGGKPGEKPGDKAGNKPGDKPDQAGDKPGQPGDAGAAQSGGGQQPQQNEVGAGGAAGGDRNERAADGGVAPPARKEMEWTEQDQANARNAADLALAHLRDAVKAGRTDVLEALGWTPEQARAFLDRWEAMRRQADTGDAKEQSRFERTLQSLGLRPDGIRSSRDVPADAKGGQTEGRRTKPPADYRDQFRAFLQGTSVSGNGE